VTPSKKGDYISSDTHFSGLPEYTSPMIYGSFSNLHCPTCPHGLHIDSTYSKEVPWNSSIFHIKCECVVGFHMESK
jgi:hypothetical protein